MRSYVGRAAFAVAYLAGLPTGKALDNTTGANATKISERDALRLASRMNRFQFSGVESYPLDRLHKKTRQQRRARQTHPGKRNRT